MVRRYPLVPLLSPPSGPAKILPRRLYLCYARRRARKSEVTAPRERDYSRRFARRSRLAPLATIPAGGSLMSSSQALNLAVERREVDAEDFSGLGLVAADLGQDALDMLALHFLQGQLEPLKVGGGNPLTPSLSGRSWEWMTSLSARITARSIAFSSSRTLPGHP